MKKIFTKSSFWLFLIILLGALLRLYKINSPILDLYPVRQEQCAMLARNFFRNSFNIMNGEVDWYGNFNSRWLLELPLISYLSACFYKLFGIKEVIGRLIAVFFSIGSIAVFYLLVKDFFNKQTALLSAFIFSILPLNIYFSRVFMPEPLMIFFNLVLIWSFNRWLNSNKKVYYFAAVVFGTLSFLIKIPTLILLGILAYLAYLKWGWRMIFKFSLWFFLILVLMPVFYWYSKTNLRAVELLTISTPPVVVLKNPHFYIRMFKSFGIFVITPFGIIPFLAGMLKEIENRKDLTFYVWFILLMASLCFTAERNYIHYYYQLPFVPVVAVFIARGLLFFNSSDFWKVTVLKKIRVKTITILTLVLMFLCSWISIQPFYNYNSYVYEAGLKVRQLTEPDNLIIAGRCSNQAPLYYCDRKGWEINEEGGLSNALFYCGSELKALIFQDEFTILKYLISQGADYYFTCDLPSFYSSQKLTDYLNDNYKIILKSDKYLLYSLKSA